MRTPLKCVPHPCLRQPGPRSAQSILCVTWWKMKTWSLLKKKKSVSRSKQEAQVGLESPAGPASEGLTSGHWCPALASTQHSDVLSSLKNAQVARWLSSTTGRGHPAFQPGPKANIQARSVGRNRVSSALGEPGLALTTSDQCLL